MVKSSQSETQEFCQERSALVESLKREKKLRVLAEAALRARAEPGKVGARHSSRTVLKPKRRGVLGLLDKAGFALGKAFRRESPGASRVRKRVASDAQSMRGGDSDIAVEAKLTPYFTNNTVPSPGLVLDVCIVTTCSFPGGNASSTLDELAFFSKLGLRVLLVHCPTSKNSKRISERYAPWMDKIVHVDDVPNVRCKVLIVRHPRVIASERFQRFATQLECDRGVFVVNNSAYRQTGEAVFRWHELVELVERFPYPEKSIHPIGPAVREEAIKEGMAHALADVDWSPTFNAEQIPFVRRCLMIEPFVIGRHGRDGAEKWLESSEGLLSAYPSSSEIYVKILGGANKAKLTIGTIPDNWLVYPFGSVNVPDFLSSLDVFVYFPHSELNEAFGRTIVEAAFSGLPCILPPRFRTTFGDLALYCEPGDVVNLLQRLAQDNVKRQHFVSAVRDEAVSRYESSALLRRLPELSSTAGSSEIGQQSTISAELLEYKRWVERGSAPLND